MEVSSILLAPLAFLVTILNTVQAQAVGGGNTCDLMTYQCRNGMCELQQDGFLGCTCSPGHIKDPQNPLLCHVIPPCNLLPGTPDQQCANGYCQMQANRMFGCTCYPGYQTSPSNLNICEDIDECSLPSIGCAFGSCANLPGTYFCTACKAGYEQNRVSGKCEKPVVQSHKFNSFFPWFWMFDGWW